MTLLELEPKNFNQPESTVVLELVNDSYTTGNQVPKPRYVLPNILSDRSFQEYKKLDHNSRGAINKRLGFARAFGELATENPHIIRGEE